MTQKNVENPIPEYAATQGRAWIDAYLPGWDQAQIGFKRVIEGTGVDHIWRDLHYKQIPLGIKRELLQSLFYELDLIDFDWIAEAEEEGDPIEDINSEHAFDLLHNTYQTGAVPEPEVTESERLNQLRKDHCDTVWTEVDELLLSGISIGELSLMADFTVGDGEWIFCTDIYHRGNEPLCNVISRLSTEPDSAPEHTVKFLN